jgi:recombinational DNA repair ATPase RecF
VHLTRLRLLGFKSFVDPTELLIAPGLTGVVGPNGCGKSNLLEALRWVMGENRASAMRGDGMEDVIFAGSGARPGRAHGSLQRVQSHRVGCAQYRLQQQQLRSDHRHRELAASDAARVEALLVGAR